MNFFRPIATVCLASLVLMSSIGVTVNFHLCGGKVQSVALFTKAKPCVVTEKACHDTKPLSKKMGCCQEESILLKGKETNAEVQTAAQITPSFNLIAVILPVLYSLNEVDSFNATPRYAYYKPPLIDRDITVFVQSFLI